MFKASEGSPIGQSGVAKKGVTALQVSEALLRYVSHGGGTAFSTPDLLDHRSATRRLDIRMACLD